MPSCSAAVPSKATVVSLTKRGDFSSAMELKPDHEARPIWVLPDGRMSRHLYLTNFEAEDSRVVL
jgi:hypothetical protein